MSSGIEHLVFSGPLLLAVPVAAAAGAVTFLSPCVLPLVPGYLSYVTGMSGASVTAPLEEPGTAAVAASTAAVPATRKRSPVLLGTALFVLGFSVLFAAEGAAIGDFGVLLRTHATGITQVLGALTIVLGLLFAGFFDRIPLAGRVLRPSTRPRVGLAGAPLLGVMFGLSWAPCTGPTLIAALSLAMMSGTAARGALLLFAYSLGLGVPFLVVAFAFQRGVNALGFARRHARLIARVGGLLLVVVGVLEVTGAWSAALAWLQTHWIAGDQSPL